MKPGSIAVTAMPRAAPLSASATLSSPPAGLAKSTRADTARVLSFSRGSFVGVVVALGALGVARYRRLLWIILLVGLVVALLPVAQTYEAHLLEGLQGQDLATQMRFGEYKDAFILIGRHPWLGVGFAGDGRIVGEFTAPTVVLLLSCPQMSLRC